MYRVKRAEYDDARVLVILRTRAKSRGRLKDGEEGREYEVGLAYRKSLDVRIGLAKPVVLW